jgi:hypothetical protein
MNVRRIQFDAADLRPHVDHDTIDDEEIFVGFAGGAANAVLTEGQLYEIAEAWRSAYDAVIEARHGVEAVV